MKKIGKILFFFATVFAIFSCNSNFNSDVYVDNLPYEESIARHISGEISNYATYESYSMYDFSSPSNSRMIAPDDVTISTNYSYFLYGKQSDGQKTFEAYKKLNVVNGKFDLEIEAIDWILTLFALEADAETPTFTSLPPSLIRNNALLMGVSAAMLTNLDRESKITISFSLSSDDLLGPGYADFTVKLANGEGSPTWYSKYESFPNISARAEIQNSFTGQPIAYVSSQSQLLSFAPGSGEAHFGGVGINPTTHDNYEIAPGTYTFAVKFYSDSELIGLWCDILEIKSGRTCNNTVYVPDLLNEKPAAPASFTATYLKDSEDSSGHTGYYKVHFQWENTPENEQYYEIQIAACHPTTVLTNSELTDSVWADAGSSGQIVLGRDFTTKDCYFDGSLFANSTDATVYLKLGERYLARIRSVNEMAASEWTQVTIPDGTTSGTGVVATDEVTGYTGGTLEYFKNNSGTVAKTINRERLTYNLNNGTYYRSSTVAKNNYGPIYFTHEGLNSTDNVGVEYWNGNGWNNSSEEDDLRKVETDMIGNTVKYKFSAWSDNFSALSTSLVSSPYKEFKNQTVYAYFEEDTSGIGPDLQYKFLAKWVSYNLNGGGYTPISTSDTAKRAVLILSKSTNLQAGNIHIGFSVAVPSGNIPGDFSQFAVNVFDEDERPVASSSALAVGNAATFGSISMNSWEKGIYTIVITATLEDAYESTPYMVNLTLDLRD